MPLQAGAQLGPYVITRSLGRGGMGQVFEAEDTRLRRRVAIKTLRPELLSDPPARRRFEREAEALSRLSHPNICTIFDIGHHDGIDFIVMEYLDGETLAALLDRGPLEAGVAVAYAIQIAEALAEAHECGVLHRDIKPQNVMITARRGVKVLDFGLAKGATPPLDGATTVSGVSAAGAVVGTAPYMAPEQIRGEPADASSDIFSFGIVLYEALSGQPAFAGRTPVEAMSAVLTKEPAPLARVAPDTPPELQRIVRKCLDKDRIRRYQTARDLATDLENLRGASGEDERQPAIASPLSRHSARRRSSLALAAVAALLVAAVGVAVASRWRTVVPPAPPTIRAMAILPLKPLAAGVGENYLGLGIADGLITRLSRVPHLTLRPTSAVRRYADDEADAVKAGADLQVDAVLEGSWLRDREQVRVSVNLLRVADGRSLWADQFDFPLADVFRIQDRVSDELASRLRLEIDSDNRRSIGLRGTNSTEAYDAYLRGQFALGLRRYDHVDRREIDKAIEFLERAVTLDPNYAEARAKLGFAYAHVAIFVENNPALVERAKRETDAAERLRPDLGQVQLNRALLWWSWYEGWRIVDAIRASRRASQLDPALGDIELAAGYAHLGLFDEWRRAGEGVIARDPTNRSIRFTFVNEHFLLNLAEQGLAAQKRLLNQDPDGRYFLLTKRIDEAAPLVHANAAKFPDRPGPLADLALLKALQGQHREADALVSKSSGTSVRNRSYHHLTYTFARVYGLAGNGDEAARWLEETVNWGFPCYPVFSTDPFLAPVRNSPRFNKVLSDLKVTWEGYRDALR